MFERLRHWEARTPPVVREQLTTGDLQSRAMLVEAIARIDERLSELEQTGHLQTRDGAEVDAWQQSVTQSSSDVARGLEQLADVCARLTERLEANELENRALREILPQLMPSLPTAIDASSRTLRLIDREIPAEDEIVEIPRVEDVQVLEPAAAEGEPIDEISLVVEARHDEISLDDDFLFARHEPVMTPVTASAAAAPTAPAPTAPASTTPASNTPASTAPASTHPVSAYPASTHSILGHLTEVLNRRGDREVLRMSSRVRRISNSQWARHRPRGDDH